MAKKMVKHHDGKHGHICPVCIHPECRDAVNAYQRELYAKNGGKPKRIVKHRYGAKHGEVLSSICEHPDCMKAWAQYMRGRYHGERAYVAKTLLRQSNTRYMNRRKLA